MLRHGNLVYATALRQVGDSATAEEITQNVFLALARKAPRLGRMETLAGWLHRTAILEAKARVRADLRRKRREEAAAEQIQAVDRTVSGLGTMVPLLDEALLCLRETDRVALVLRYFEDLSLREVGTVLGVEEEAARKRVARALDKVTEFFRKRGFALSTVGGAAGLMAGSAKAAPAIVTGSILRAASTVALPAGIQVGLFHLLSLTKLQTAVLCIAAAAVPLIIQFRAEASLRTERNAMESQLSTTRERVFDAESATARLHEELYRLEQGGDQANRQRERVEAQIAGRAAVPEYRWDDSSPYARVPKAFARVVQFPAMADRRGNLTEQVKEVLQMTQSEADSVQESINRFLKTYESIVASRVKQVEPDERDRRWHPGQKLRVFEIAETTGEFLQLRATLFEELATSLGAERADLFRQKLLYWMPIDDESTGPSSLAAIHPGEHRIRLALEDQPGEFFSFSISQPSGSGVSSIIGFDDLPDYLQPMMRDWIEETVEKSKGGSK